MKLTPQELCQAINSKLQFRQAFKPWVYQVEKEGQFYVLKFGVGNSQQLITETELLTAAKDVLGITHLVSDYGLINDGTAETHCILKEYAPGKTLDSVDFDERKKLSESVKQSLYDTVQELHALRIARLGIHSGDIVINPEQTSATIVDLDMALRYDECEEINFSRAKETDLWCINKLL